MLQQMVAISSVFIHLKLNKCNLFPPQISGLVDRQIPPQKKQPAQKQIKNVHLFRKATDLLNTEQLTGTDTDLFF